MTEDDHYFLEKLITKLRISTDLSTVYHLKNDGLTEIMNSVFEQYLKTYVNNTQNDWAFWLPTTEFIINNHVSKTENNAMYFFNHFKTIS